jgi:acetyltransferase-like isoleucine patch superfamily enzyme
MVRLRTFLGMRLADKLSLIHRLGVRLKGILYYRRVFGGFGRGSSLDKPLLLSNPHLIHIGERVYIRPGVRLEAVACDGTNEPELRIGDDVRIEQSCRSFRYRSEPTSCFVAVAFDHHRGATGNHRIGRKRASHNRIHPNNTMLPQCHTRHDGSPKTKKTSSTNIDRSLSL